MTLKNLIDLKISNFYDTLFVLADDIIDNQLVISKFYVNEEEYAQFASCIDRYKGRKYDIECLLSYKYKIISHTIELGSFLKLFECKINTNNSSEIVDVINDEIKNKSIDIRNSNFQIVENNNRKLVNSYFEELHLLERRDNEVLSSINSISFPKKQDVRFRMYNVGQANFSCLLVDDKPKIIFDIGKSRKCDAALKLLENLKNNDNLCTIIVSHYDDDHINMSKYLPDYGANLQFLIPEFLHASHQYKPNIQLLLIRAVANGNKVYFIPNGVFGKHYLRFNYCYIFNGSSHKLDVNQSTNENSHGLVVYLKIRGKKVLVPGDVLYDDLTPNFDFFPLKPNYLVVPHHACKYSDIINPNILDTSNIIETFTFCGPNRKYKHPNKTHFNHFLQKNTKLVRLANSNNKTYESAFDAYALIKDTYYTILFDKYYDWIL